MAVGQIETGLTVVTLMLTATFGPSQAPWLVWVAIGAIILVAVVGNLVSGFRTAVTVLATLKSIVDSGASVAGRPVTMPQLLSGPVDLVGDGIAAGLLANPLLALVSTIIAAVQKSRQAGGTEVPRQYVTDRLAPILAAGLLRLPPGAFSVTELHARPIAGDRMLIWFRASLQGAGPFTEYWTFVSSRPSGILPLNCPRCGAPTAATSAPSSTCRYCHANLWQPSADSQTYWLVDDISRTPPAAIAA